MTPLCCPDCLLIRYEARCTGSPLFASSRQARTYPEHEFFYHNDVSYECENSFPRDARFEPDATPTGPSVSSPFHRGRYLYCLFSFHAISLGNLSVRFSLVRFYSPLYLTDFPPGDFLFFSLLIDRHGILQFERVSSKILPSFRRRKVLC